MYIPTEIKINFEFMNIKYSNMQISKKTPNHILRSPIDDSFNEECIVTYY